ncbi:hypothetical protein D3C72_1355330 [compost metagenome]
MDIHQVAAHCTAVYFRAELWIIFKILAEEIQERFNAIAHKRIMLLVVFHNQPLRHADIMLIKETGVQIFHYL